MEAKGITGMHIQWVQDTWQMEPKWLQAGITLLYCPPQSSTDALQPLDSKKGLATPEIRQIQLMHVVFR